MMCITSYLTYPNYKHNMFTVPGLEQNNGGEESLR
jgi:hypothetical protein